MPHNVHDMANAAEDVRAKMVKMYWNKICDASGAGLFNWMAHLDLPRKVKVGMGDEWRLKERMVIDKLAQNNMPIEVNTGLRPEPYPSFRILKMAADVNLPVLISDDAHRADQIGRYFDQAEDLCQRAGVKNRLSLQKILDFSNKTL